MNVIDEQKISYRKALMNSFLTFSHRERFLFLKNYAKFTKTKNYAMQALLFL